jgi:hypothetical protein
LLSHKRQLAASEVPQQARRSTLLAHRGAFIPQISVGGPGL